MEFVFMKTRGSHANSLPVQLSANSQIFQGQLIYVTIGLFKKKCEVVLYIYASVQLLNPSPTDRPHQDGYKLHLSN